MNITANNVASKLFVGFVAAAMLFTLAPSAKAQTAAELQAQIDALMAQIASLSGTTSTGSTATACTFTRALTVGSQGEDVKCLQTFLTPTYFTNAGGATGYFGPVTAAAVAAWQSANGIAPAVGYFGPVSQAKYAMVATTPTTPGEDDSDEDTSTGDLSGEGVLDDVQIDSASDDDVEEGAEDAEIATVTLEAADGDIEVSRIDVAIDGGATDAWDVLDEVSLWIDGDEVARMDASDEDEYQSDDVTLRFSGLDFVVEEDEEVEIVIAATVQGNVDTLDLGAYDVSVDSIRYFDADGVAETDSTTGDLGSDVSFTLVEAGDEDELIVKTSADDVDGTTLQVEDDSKSDFYTVFVFDLDTDDSVNDIELNAIDVDVTVSSSTFNAVVDDYELVIDGVTIDDLADNNGGTAGDYTDGASVTLTFDVDGDVTIDAGDRVSAELRLRFKSLPLGNEGITVMAEVDDADAIEAEGADDLTTAQLSGAAEGDAHSLRTSGIDVSVDGTPSAAIETQDGADNDVIRYTIEVEVTAFEQDVYFDTDDSVALDWALATSSGGELTVASGSTTVIFSSTASETNGAFEVTEGSTETFTIEVTYKPAGDATAARLQLNSLTFGSASGTPTGQTWTASPTEDYRTATKAVAD